MSDWTSDYEFITCYLCGCRFGAPRHFVKSRREDKNSFFCPNGHSQAFVESEVEKLRRERDKLKQNQAYLEDQIRTEQERTAKAEAATKRLKKRTSAGTCPCCKRTFSNMAEHMKHRHPQFVCDSGAKVVPIKRGA